jgi:hypothetical protein
MMLIVNLEETRLDIFQSSHNLNMSNHAPSRPFLTRQASSHYIIQARDDTVSSDICRIGGFQSTPFDSLALHFSSGNYSWILLWA